MIRWVYCPKCRHKLFKVWIGSNAEVEVKCHSCKNIIHVSVSNGKIKAVVDNEAL